MTDSGFSSEEPSWLAAERVETGDSSPVPSSPSAVETASLSAGETVSSSAVETASLSGAETVSSSAVGTALSSAGEASSPAFEKASSATAGAVAVAEPAVAVSKASIADIEEAMKDVVDPELGINVVDLGLVYDAFVDDNNVVTLDMTLTSAACPLTDVIEDQTRAALTTGPGGGLVQDFRINWVWLPPWGPDKITDDGREQLRALGFNV